MADKISTNEKYYAYESFKQDTAKVDAHKNQRIKTTLSSIVGEFSRRVQNVFLAIKGKHTDRNTEAGRALKHLEISLGNVKRAVKDSDDENFSALSLTSIEEALKVFNTKPKGLYKHESKRFLKIKTDLQELKAELESKLPQEEESKASSSKKSPVSSSKSSSRKSRTDEATSVTLSKSSSESLPKLPPAPSRIQSVYPNEDNLAGSLDEDDDATSVTLTKSPSNSIEEESEIEPDESEEGSTNPLENSSYEPAILSFTARFSNEKKPIKDAMENFSTVIENKFPDLKKPSTKSVEWEKQTRNKNNLVSSFEALKADFEKIESEDDVKTLLDQFKAFKEDALKLFTITTAGLKTKVLAGVSEELSSLEEKVNKLSTL